MIVFSLTLLLLMSVSICVGGNNAFAKDNHTFNPPQVVNLDCSVTPPTVLVAGFSKSTDVAVTLTVGEECAQALADLGTAGLKITGVQTVGTNVVYTLTSKGISD